MTVLPCNGEHSRFTVVARVKRDGDRIAEWCPMCGAFRFFDDVTATWSPWMVPMITRECMEAVQ